MGEGLAIAAMSARESGASTSRRSVADSEPFCFPAEKMARLSARSDLSSDQVRTKRGGLDGRPQGGSVAIPFLINV